MNGRNGNNNMSYRFTSPDGRVVIHQAFNVSSAGPDGIQPMGLPLGLQRLEQMFGIAPIQGPIMGLDGLFAPMMGNREQMERFMEEAFNNGPRGPPPTAKATIDKLLRIENDIEGATCVICMDEIELGSEVVQLPCEHEYHPDCVITWLKMNNRCPTCRYELPSQNANEEVKEDTVQPDDSAMDLDECYCSIFTGDECSFADPEDDEEEYRVYISQCNQGHYVHAPSLDMSIIDEAEECLVCNLLGL